MRDNNIQENNEVLEKEILSEDIKDKDTKDKEKNSYYRNYCTCINSSSFNIGIGLYRYNKFAIYE